LRDLLIGIAVAHPSGTVTKAGGMVVKNVSGYDMPRLYLGSLGTLGVITSANFKVLPRPRAEATLVASAPTAEAAFAAAWSVHAANEPVAALEVAFDGDAWTTAVRIEGREPTVEKLAARVSERLGQTTTRHDGGNSATWWAEYVARQRSAAIDIETPVQFRCGVRPRETALLTEGIVAALSNLGIPVSQLAASPGIGTIFVEMTLDTREQLAEVQQILLGLAEVVTLLSAPPAWKSGLDVWGRSAEGFAVSQSLRQEFDPDRVLNPGRFAGFL
jgi:glycolate oxidase FAD binding subunit